MINTCLPFHEIHMYVDHIKRFQYTDQPAYVQCDGDDVIGLEKLLESFDEFDFGVRGVRF